MLCLVFFIELFFKYFLGVLGIWERWRGDGLFAKAGDSSESYSRYDTLQLYSIVLNEEHHLKIE